jgi:hypothetical protein
MNKSFKDTLLESGPPTRPELALLLRASWLPFTAGIMAGWVFLMIMFDVMDHHRPEPYAPSVEWFVSHQPERKATVDFCGATDPRITESWQVHLACANARAAQ